MTWPPLLAKSCPCADPARLLNLHASGSEAQHSESELPEPVRAPQGRKLDWRSPKLIGAALLGAVVVAGCAGASIHSLSTRGSGAASAMEGVPPPSEDSQRATALRAQSQRATPEVADQAAPAIVKDVSEAKVVVPAHALAPAGAKSMTVTDAGTSTHSPVVLSAKVVSKEAGDAQVGAGTATTTSSSAEPARIPRAPAPSDDLPREPKATSTTKAAATSTTEQKQVPTSSEQIVPAGKASVQQDAKHDASSKPNDGVPAESTGKATTSAEPATKATTSAEPTTKKATTSAEPTTKKTTTSAEPTIKQTTTSAEPTTTTKAITSAEPTTKASTSAPAAVKAKDAHPTTARPPHSPDTPCAGSGEDCSASHCCQQPGFQCYRQDNAWASCKSTCTEHGWNCTELGARAPADVPPEGAGPGEVCAVAQKCQQEGYQCYQQNDYYSACKITCHAEDWTCKKYGERTPMKNTTECAWGADICAPQGCCVAEGLQCYERDEYWSSCMSSCENSMDFGNGPEHWSCKKVGERKPVELGCTWKQEECTITKACCHADMQCIQKTDRVAYCWYSTDEPGWLGTIVGPGRSEWQVQAAASDADCTGTSLFCLMVVLPGSYEEGLMQTAKDKGASIFGCDASGVFQSWQSARVDDGTWQSVVNTDVFVNVYEQVHKDGRYLDYAWTVKVDPDSVFFPDRLRYQLQQLHAPKNMPIYIKNTDKDFGFLGACEVLSRDALIKYFRYYHECFESISAHSGEDGFMKGCMDMVGAGYMVSYDVLRTPHHDGPCSDAARVTFHPYKDVGSWDSCYSEATR